DHLAPLVQIPLQRVDVGVNVGGLDSVVPQQRRQVAVAGSAGGAVDRSGVASAGHVRGRGGDLGLGGLVAGDLADHVGHRHLAAVEVLLLVAPEGRSSGRV